MIYVSYNTYFKTMDKWVENQMFGVYEDVESALKAANTRFRDSGIRHILYWHRVNENGRIVRDYNELVEFGEAY